MNLDAYPLHPLQELYSQLGAKQTAQVVPQRFTMDLQPVPNTPLKAVVLTSYASQVAQATISGALYISLVHRASQE